MHKRNSDSAIQIEQQNPNIDNIEIPKRPKVPIKRLLPDKRLIIADQKDFYNYRGSSLEEYYPPPIENPRIIKVDKDKANDGKPKWLLFATRWRTWNYPEEFSVQAVYDWLIIEEYLNTMGMELSRSKDRSECIKADCEVLKNHADRLDEHRIGLMLEDYFRHGVIRIPPDRHEPAKEESDMSKSKKRGRKPKYDPEKDKEFKEDWKRAKSADVDFKTFCKDKGLKLKDGDRILTRVRGRRGRNSKYKPRQ